jgi:colanic acid/amylovoran biosynthesis glycosyltransferase
VRVAVICASFPELSETFILRQIVGMLDRGHDVRIFADSRPDGGARHADFVRYRLSERTTYTCTVGPRLQMVQGLIKAIECFIRAPRITAYVMSSLCRPVAGRKIRVFFRLAELLRLKPDVFDVVHCHQGYVANNYLFLTRLWSSPFVVSFHGVDISAFVKSHGARVYAELFGKLAVATANSNYTKQRLIALGCPVEKIEVLPVGLDPSRFTFSPRAHVDSMRIRFLTVGRMTEKKGLEYSIKAFAKVHQSLPATEYWIIGDGPLRTELVSLIRHLGLHNCVRLLGALDSESVTAQMNNAHIFVLASVTAANGDTEGQGLVLQEAQSTGLPVIATDHNGFPDSIVPNKSGRLVPERDIDRLAGAMYEFAVDSDNWPEMGRAGRAHVEAHFDIHELNIRLEKIYAKVVSTVGEGRLQ